jgi:hypothetical protein
LSPDPSADALAVELGGQIRICGQICSRGYLVRFGPKVRRNGQWIDLLLFPPRTLIAASMEFAMVQTADRDREPVADFPSYRPLFGELDVVGVGGGAPTDEARLGGHKR